MVSGGRLPQLAGPLVALHLLPAASALGMALVLGKGGTADRSLGRLAIDIGMVLVAGLIIFTYRHVRVQGPGAPRDSHARPASQRSAPAPDFTADRPENAPYYARSDIPG
jgi:hypothetical protein